MAFSVPQRSHWLFKKSSQPAAHYGVVQVGVMEAFKMPNNKHCDLPLLRLQGSYYDCSIAWIKGHASAGFVVLSASQPRILLTANKVEDGHGCLLAANNLLIIFLTRPIFTLAGSLPLFLLKCTKLYYVARLDKNGMRHRVTISWRGENNFTSHC